MDKKYVQVNVSMTREDAEMLDLLASRCGYDNRSAYVRRLLRAEARQHEDTRLAEGQQTDDRNITK